MLWLITAMKLGKFISCLSVSVHMLEQQESNVCDTRILILHEIEAHTWCEVPTCLQDYSCMGVQMVSMNGREDAISFIANLVSMQEA